MTRSSPAARRRAAPAPTPAEAAAARARRDIPLDALDIAPENLRAAEPPDDDIPLLADTLAAAGQLQPITVRPGRRGERPWMALDGRRRLLALRLLADQGRGAPDRPVDAVVETDPARQAAAAVLTNTASPVHIADVIAAIGRMRTARLGIAAIARAVGHAEIDIKRLAALSALPVEALDALRAGQMTLRQARLLVRLPDPALQAELARAARDGQGFADWRVAEMLDQSQVTARDARCALVSPEAYTAAGGRTETDLFGERAPVLLDPPVLTALWTARAAAIAAMFEAEGLTVHVSAGEEPELPDDLETPGPVWSGSLPPERQAAWRDARDAHEAAAQAVEAALAGGGADAAEGDQALAALVRAALVRDQIALGGMAATTLVFTPSARTGLSVQVWAPIAPEDERETGEAEPTESGEVGPAAFEAPRAPAPEPEVEGVGHSLHALRTEVATRGLIRALADDPSVALTALIARLFLSLTGVVRSLDDAALGVTARAFAPPGGRIIPALDGVVRDRIEARQAAWAASGLTAIAWVHGLAEPERLALLAELTALTLDLREGRTSQIRRAARAEAGELAALCGADLARHWTPDAAFLTPHPKAMLTAMLEAMGKAPPTGAAPGKADLVALVEATAAARGWVPAVLSWQVPDPRTEAGPPADPQLTGESEAEADGGEGGGNRGDASQEPLPRLEASDGDDGNDGDDGGAGGETGADGAGAFAVTEAGRAALAAVVAIPD